MKKQRQLDNKVKRRRQVDNKTKKEKRISATMDLGELPYEIKDEIFFRLSLKTLWKFRCVIRDYSRFYNSNFMNMHFYKQMEFDNASTFIVATHSFMYQVNIHIKTYVQLKFLFHGFSKSSFDGYSNNRLRLAGSCNGLLCLTRFCDYGRVVFLWNPLTGNYKQLPDSKVRSSKLALGFGYDFNSGKFKVVAISRERRGKNPRFEAFVNTVGTSSWRSIGEAQRFLWEPNPHNSRPKVFEGCPHWIVPSLKSVISFSVGDEKFNEISMPFLANGEAEIVDFALGDRLSVFSYVVKLKRYDLWVRLKNTWTKQMSFNELDMPGFKDGYKYSGYYGYKDSELYGGPDLLDPVINSIKSERPRCNLAEPFFVFSYVKTIAEAEEDEVL